MHYKYYYKKYAKLFKFWKGYKRFRNRIDQLKDPYNSEGIAEVNTDRISNLQNEIDVKPKKFTQIWILANDFSSKQNRPK